MRKLFVILGLSMALPLVGCGDMSTTADEKPSQTKSALTYGHVWDVQYQSNGGPLANVYGAEATNMLTGWGMPLAVYDYCIDDPNFESCIPGAGHPHPAWLLFNYTTTPGNWTDAWHYTPDYTVYSESVWAPGKGTAHRCLKITEPAYNNNWLCTAGAGGPGWSAGIYAKYGQGDS